MSNDKIYIAQSKIHGKGLFAKQNIEKGEIIGIVQGVPTKIDGDHVLWINEKKGINVQCDLRYINHAKKPNVCYYDTLEVVALRDIKKGEEFTHNYMHGYESI